ncbi:MAG: YlbF family regulator [Clostridia bacterium]|nr:YlbF family regulator [Clostridia bacterium]MEE1054885.1 YlbF family regulator [Acutalibacteraceae bacterium]
MTVIESVRELGKAIQKDERFIRYAKAKLQSDSDNELQAAIGEFNITRMELEREASNGEENNVRTKELNEKLREIYGKVMSNPVMVEFNTAKVELDQMMGEVNVIISKVLDGEDPETCTTDSGCTGSCSSCGGCH